MNKETSANIFLLISLGMIIGLVVFNLTKPSTETIVKQVVSDKLQSEMYNLTVASTTSFCNKNGFINPASITQQQILQAADQIRASMATTTK